MLEQKRIRQFKERIYMLDSPSVYSKFSFRWYDVSALSFEDEDHRVRVHLSAGGYGKGRVEFYFRDNKEALEWVNELRDTVLNGIATTKGERIV